MRGSPCQPVLTYRLMVRWPLRAPRGVPAKFPARPTVVSTGEILRPLPKEDDWEKFPCPPTVVSAGLETQLSGSLRCQVALCYGSTETLLGVLVGSLEAPIALVVEGHALEDVRTMVIAQ